MDILPNGILLYICDNKTITVMKSTKVRIIQHDNYLPEYSKLIIDVLGQDKHSKYLYRIGSIEFTKRKDENRYFGLTFTTDTNKHDNIFKLAKLAKFINDNSYWNIQPDELLNLINADRHHFYNSMYVSERFNGYNFYKIMVDGIYSTSIIAANELTAVKEMEKMNINNASLVYESRINF